MFPWQQQQFATNSEIHNTLHRTSLQKQALKISFKKIKKQASCACLSTLSLNICKFEKLSYKVLYRVRRHRT